MAYGEYVIIDEIFPIKLVYVVRMKEVSVADSLPSCHLGN